MTIGLGTDSIEVMTVGDIAMDASCMATVEPAAKVPCPRGPSFEIGKQLTLECSGKGDCDAGECICDVRYEGSHCGIFHCQDSSDCLNNGVCTKVGGPLNTECRKRKRYSSV